MSQESVKTVYSRDGGSKYDVFYENERKIYEVIVYRKLYRETTDGEYWARINSAVIYTDTLENALEIGNEEIKGAGGYLS